jgi:hypothetical protein
MTTLVGADRKVLASFCTSVGQVALQGDGSSGHGCHDGGRRSCKRAPGLKASAVCATGAALPVDMW